MDDAKILEVGLRVNDAWTPICTIPSTRKPQRDDFIPLRADKIDRHTAIIAQSGSGKSFFLGRLLEETILRTRCRYLILDPNSDFRRFYQIAEGKFWAEPAYDTDRSLGRLTRETRREEFADAWKQVSVSVEIGNSTSESNSNNTSGTCEIHLQLDWYSLDISLLSEDLEPYLRREVFQCHKYFQSLADLWRSNIGQEDKILVTEILDEAERLFRHSRILSDQDIEHALRQRFRTERGDRPFLDRFARGGDPNRWIDTLIRTPRYVSEVAERFYFGMARAYRGGKAGGIIGVHLGDTSRMPDKRCRVVDLPSLYDKDTQHLAVSSRLQEEWIAVRQQWHDALDKDPDQDQRMPCFIVVDEAHNLIPAQPRRPVEEMLLQFFRTVVAEGRKYGLFLLLVTQRPDKVDPMVLSECENIVIMKLSSEAVVKEVCKLMDLPGLAEEELSGCTQLQTGRGLFFGPWIGSPTRFFSAARRTVEGGRNLRSEYWASPS